VPARWSAARGGIANGSGGTVGRVRFAMRALFVLAVPGIVFGWLTRVPPISFNMEFDFFANEVGWMDVLAALVLAMTVVCLGAIVVAALVKLGVGQDQRRSR
jgi:hypothetical protein